MRRLFIDYALLAQLPFEQCLHTHIHRVHNRHTLTHLSRSLSLAGRHGVQLPHGLLRAVRQVQSVHCELRDVRKYCILIKFHLSRVINIFHLHMYESRWAAQLYSV